MSNGIRIHGRSLSSLDASSRPSSLQGCSRVKKARVARATSSFAHPIHSSILPGERETRPPTGAFAAGTNTTL